MSDQMTESADCAMSAERTEAHAKLDPFVGTFKAEVKLWMGPGEPHTSTGVMTNTMELGGRFLHQRYEGDANDGPFPHFQGRGYWGYNTVTNQYEGFWIDSASTFMQTETGHLDGNVWTMVGECVHPQAGPMKKKSIITLIDDDHHALEMYFETPQGEMKGMEIQYKRQA